MEDIVWTDSISHILIEHDFIIYKYLTSIILHLVQSDIYSRYTIWQYSIRSRSSTIDSVWDLFFIIEKLFYFIFTILIYVVFLIFYRVPTTIFKSLCSSRTYHFPTIYLTFKFFFLSLSFISSSPTWTPSPQLPIFLSLLKCHIGVNLYLCLLSFPPSRFCNIFLIKFLLNWLLYL